MTRKQRVTRVVYAVFTVFVAVFVASSTYQVAQVLFGGSGPGPGRGAAREVGTECSAALERTIGAIESARERASAERSGDRARARYSELRATEGGTAAAEGACAREPNGPAALAALARLDRAAGAHALREAHELSPVRLAAQSFIRGPR